MFTDSMFAVDQDKCQNSWETCPMTMLKFETCSWTVNYNDFKKRAEEIP